MGDRANIVIQEEKGGKIYLYTHWAGTELPATLQAALRRGKDRWDDESYLARIIFCEMVKGQEMTEAGYGISTYEGDNDRDACLIVYPKTQTVEWKGNVWGFQDFVVAVNPIPDF